MTEDRPELKTEKIFLGKLSYGNFGEWDADFLERLDPIPVNIRKDPKP